MLWSYGSPCLANFFWCFVVLFGLNGCFRRVLFASADMFQLPAKASRAEKVRCALVEEDLSVNGTSDVPSSVCFFGNFYAAKEQQNTEREQQNN